MNKEDAVKLDRLIKLTMDMSGITKRYKERQAVDIWPQVVGFLIASNTKSLKVFEGRLYVSFTSSVVRHEVMMIKESLLDVLNDRLGEKILKELIIK